MELTAMEEMAKLRFIDFYGTDRQGQHIFAIYACRLPTLKTLNGNTETLSSFIIEQMKPYVQNDYSIVYFHQGLKEDNKPDIKFLWNAYTDLDRSFRKNLKQLYVVHPTLWIRGLWFLVQRFVSAKFRNKLIYTATLAELRQSLGMDNLNVPDNILK